MNSVCKVLLLVLLSFAFAQPSLADDRPDRGRERDRERNRDRDREDREGPRTKFENNNERYKYEYRDRNCRYEYEYNYRSGKTKIEERGDCRGVVLARPAMRSESLPRAIPPEPHARRIVCNREVLGSIIGGAVIGAVVGGVIGRAMDDADHACAAQALEYANLNQAVAWDNAARGISYVVTPVEIDSKDKSAECRKYTVRTVTGGRQQDQTGRACRRNDGSWAPVN
jgi:surface antigen